MKFYLHFFLLLTSISFNSLCSISIQTSDNKLKIYESFPEILYHSKTLKNLIEDIEDDDVIPLSNITMPIFEQVMECLKIINTNDGEIKRIHKKLKSYDTATLFNIIEAFSYLDIPHLLEIACDIWHENHAFACFENNTHQFENFEIVEKLREKLMKNVKDLYRLDYLKQYPPAQSLSLNHLQPVFSITFNPSDITLVASEGDKIRMWDCETGKSLRYLSRRYITASVNSLQFDNTGQFLVINSWFVLHILNTQTDTRRVYPPVWVSSISVKEKKIALGLVDGAVGIYDIDLDTLIYFNKIDQKSINALCFGADDSLLASGSEGGLLCFWDAAHFDNLKTIPLNDSITCICFGPDEKFFCGSKEGYIYCCTVNDNLPSNIINVFSGVNDIVYHQDLKLIAAAQNFRTTRLIDGISGKILHILRDVNPLNGPSNESVCFSQHENMLATTMAEKVKIWKICEPLKHIENARYDQLQILALCKMNDKRTNLDKPHLSQIFDSLLPEEQILIAKLENVQLPLRKKITLAALAHKKFLKRGLQELIMANTPIGLVYNIVQRAYLVNEIHTVLTQ